MIALLILFIKAPLLDLIADQKFSVADLFDAHAAQHLADDHFDVLVVDAHAPEADKFLALRRLDTWPTPFRPRMFKMSCGFDEPSISDFTGSDPIGVVDADMFALRDQIFARLAHFGSDDDFALCPWYLCRTKRHRRFR
mgnify:CR=1 FL=1